MTRAITLWRWEDAPVEHRDRFTRMVANLSIATPANDERPAANDEVFVAHVPEALLTQLLEPPSWLVPIWRHATRAVRRSKTADGMLFLWTVRG